MIYYLVRVTMPGSARTWALASDSASEFFDTYRTKKEAMEDVREHELEFTTNGTYRPRASDFLNGYTSVRNA
jgi:hypothetical protein